MPTPQARGYDTYFDRIPGRTLGFRTDWQGRTVYVRAKPLRDVKLISTTCIRGNEVSKCFMDNPNSSSVDVQGIANDPKECAALGHEKVWKVEDFVV